MHVSATGMPSQDGVRQIPRRYSRWRIMFSLWAERCCGLLGGRRFYRALHLRAGRFEVRRETIDVPNLPEALDGFCIAHLSDLHAGRFVREGDLAAVVEAVNAEEVDLLALTGDYITHHPTDAFRLAEDLGRLRSRFGGFAVFGNHDYRGREEARIAERFGEVGFRFLRNEGVRLECDGAVLGLTGVEDLEEGKVVDPDRARSALRAGDLEILLCHNPRGGELLAREGCVAVLSGHTHGGQIALPGARHLIRSIGPSHPGDRVRYESTTLIVNRGLGVVALPVRFCAPAEVVIVTLRRERAGGDDGR